MTDDLTNPRDYTDDELEDAARSVNARLYPERAKALDEELIRRRGTAAIEDPSLEVACGARIGWVYHDYPLARLRLYRDRIEIAPLIGTSQTLRLERITELRMEREFLLEWLQIRHSEPDLPQYAVWTFQLRTLEATLRRALTPA